MRRLLTTIEKLDGRYPGLGTKVRIWLDHGETAEEIQKRLRDEYGVTVGDDAINYHRRNRWWPLKEQIQQELVTVKGIIEMVGGDAGIDMFMSARLLQDLDELKEKSLIDAKELFIKIRAQDLKEEEFKFKAAQMKPDGDDAELDPAAEEAKRKRVMNKIRGIFGLDPLPEEETTEEPGESEATDQASPAPSEASATAVSAFEVAGDDAASEG